MWVPLQDCGKQLTINSRLREKLDDSYKIYEITEVEYDQYHLNLLSKNDVPAEDISQVVKATKLIAYRFEVEQKEKLKNTKAGFKKSKPMYLYRVRKNSHQPVLQADAGGPMSAA